MKHLLRVGLLALTILVIGLTDSRMPSCKLPILMYHHFEEVGEGHTIVSEERFREQMTALKNAGYETVTLRQLCDYVSGEAKLPEKPILITMDDGYSSNLEIAAPILEELGMCATVFVIGINEGEEVYVHSGEPFWDPRFSYEEAKPWVEKGVIDVQCHTYDMHQLESYGYSGREGVLQLGGESREEYEAALRQDFETFRRRREIITETALLGLAYPFGYYTPETDEFLKSEIDITLTIEERLNILTTGELDCLRMLGRFNVTDQESGKDLADRMDWEMLIS